jgi:DNA-binding FadR family transcriptional regulator
MAQFEVSRTVVREAISHLQANKLVETRHGVGTFALAPQSTDNFQIVDVENIVFGERRFFRQTIIFAYNSI